MRKTGQMFRRLRRLRGLKQSHAAELLGVSQATISRWETGALPLSDKAERAMVALMTAKSSAADYALKRLVSHAPFPIHLICDLTHTLLAASPAREAAWRRSASDVLGESVWRYASAQIQDVECQLPELGWGEVCPPAVAFWTGANHDDDVPIVPGLVLWERVALEGGRQGRLVSTVARPPAHALLVSADNA
jgi:transcriptional regulator with XRE-family HTH domain